MGERCSCSYILRAVLSCNGRVGARGGGGGRVGSLFPPLPSCSAPLQSLSLSFVLSSLTVHAEQHAAVVHHVSGVEGAVRGDGHSHAELRRQHLEPRRLVGAAVRTEVEHLFSGNEEKKTMQSGTQKQDGQPRSTNKIKNRPFSYSQLHDRTVNHPFRSSPRQIRGKKTRPPPPAASNNDDDNDQHVPGLFDIEQIHLGTQLGSSWCKENILATDVIGYVVRVAVP